MQFPIYDYYIDSSMRLEDILSHYVENFYLRKHGRDKYEKILKKLSDSNKVRKLFDQSYNQKLAINNVDFGATVNEMMWFVFQSNETQAVAVLAMAVFWNTNVNSHLHLKGEKELRDDALKIFKKFSIYGDMTKEEFDSMRLSQDNELDESDYDENDDDDEIGNDNDSEKGDGYHILNFYLDCSHWHRQEDEIKKCPLTLPVKIIDVDKEDDITSKYSVRNLPTLILVDGNGKEIKRWVGITPTSEINEFIIDKGYSAKSGGNDKNDMDLSGIPNEIRSKMNNLEFKDKMMAILAEGGTEEQIKQKMNYLTGVEEKPDEIIRLENQLRNLYRKRFDAIGERILNESSNFDIMHKIKATTILSKFNQDLEDKKFFPEIDDIRVGASKVGICVNIIKDEEYQRALDKYRDGKSVD